MTPKTPRRSSPARYHAFDWIAWELLCVLVIAIVAIGQARRHHPEQTAQVLERLAVGGAVLAGVAVTVLAMWWLRRRRQG